MKADSTIKPLSMGKPMEDSIHTSLSLLQGMRDLDNHGSWGEFYRTYARVIHDAARSQGLSEVEAQDVVQETLLSVARTMPDFQYDPARCSFKTWLLHLTRKRIVDHFRRRPRHGLIFEEPDGDPRTALVERIPDPSGPDLNVVWENEWRENLLDLALERLKPQVSPMHFQLFYLVVIKQSSPRQVANAFDVSLGLVYLVKHRLTPRFKRLVVSLRQQIGEN